MTEQNQKQLGNTLWSIADQLRGAMNADEFRDYQFRKEQPRWTSTTAFSGAWVAAPAVRSIP